MKFLVLYFLLVSLLQASDRPNILLIMVDDLGFSDLGCYGSEIETPSIDKLAKEGTRLANFRVNVMCTVTRTSLMTGHAHAQSPKYQNSYPLPRALRDAGYHTSLSGKWHQPRHPHDQGFDQFYGFLKGQINSMTGSKQILDQREKVKIAEGWYATEAFTDQAIRFIDQAREAEKPFFTFLSYNAPHTPLHIKKEAVEKYRGKFLEGWEKLRKKRLKRLKELGMVDSRYKLHPPGAEVRPWDELSEETKKLEDFRMATYAAVIERIDQNVARVLDHLEKNDLSENTLVIFLSDNGGDYSNGHIRTDDQKKPWNSKDLFYMSNGWATLKCAPFHLYKTSSYEGGVRVPFIMRWPEGLKHEKNTVLKHQAHISDLYPTLLEIAGAELKKPKLPLMGKSIFPLLKDPSLPLGATQHPVFWSFHATSRGYLDYPWKINSVNSGPWKLYHLEEDPTEANDLRESQRGKFEELEEAWWEFARTQTDPGPDWHVPLTKYDNGWGWHRFMIIWPFVTSDPLVAATEVPLDTDITFEFSEALDFTETEGKVLRLYRLQDPENPVWSFDPEPDHPGQGQKRVTFDDLPVLESDSTYFMTTDQGWARARGKALPPLNDGAFWYRFRTAK